MSRCHQGFTLLEVLLAITVLGVVMTMLLTSLSVTLRGVEATEQQEAVFAQAQVTMRRITEDLVAAVSVPKVPFTGKKNDDQALRLDTLTFCSRAHVVLNPEKQRPGLAVLRYRLRQDPEDLRQWHVLRSDTPILPTAETSEQATDETDQEEAAEPGFLLAQGVRSLEFQYFDQKGQEFDSWEELQSPSSSTDQQNPQPGATAKAASQARERQQPTASPSDQEAPATQTLPVAVQCTLEMWIDPERGLSQTFTTRVPIVAGGGDAL